MNTLLQLPMMSTGEDAEARPYTCKLCDASFSKRFCLTNHIVTIHQVGGKYVCVHCGKQFLQKLRYLTHVDRHDNVRRHVCSTCGRAYSYKYSLWSHAKKCSGRWVGEKRVEQKLRVDGPHKAKLGDDGQHGVDLSAVNVQDGDEPDGDETADGDVMESDGGASEADTEEVDDVGMS